jgi:dTDP-4-amino-4,6-dideoxy-D-galactose acyltransferase
LTTRPETAAGSGVCQRLEWDSDFWGFGCARVQGHKLRKGQMPAIDAWCHVHDITFLQYLAPADDPTSARHAEEGGFRLVDERVTLACRITAGNSDVPGVELRPGRMEDVSELEAIARISHTDSRYYSDPGFPRAGCDSLYSTWIRRSLEGAIADIVFVPVIDGEPAGYVTCKRDAQAPKKGWIGLVGVGPTARGRGVGGALVRRAIDWFREAGVEEALVVTQGRNEPAKRLYGRCGFVARDTALWYHKWFGPSAAGARDGVD